MFKEKHIFNERTFMSKKLFQSIKNHKKEILLGTCIVAVSAIGGIVIFKNWDSVKTIFYSKTAKTIPSKTNKTCSKLEPSKRLCLPVEITDNLTGEMLTARKLGRETLCSDREINKRLVEKGLQVKNQFNEYDITELGKAVGVNTWKTTYSGHDFCNNEWDSIVIKYLFSPEELKEIADRKMRISEILEPYAA